MKINIHSYKKVRKLMLVTLLLMMALTGCTKLTTYIVVDNNLLECTILEAGAVGYLIQYEYGGEIITANVWKSEIHNIDSSKVKDNYYE